MAQRSAGAWWVLSQVGGEELGANGLFWVIVPVLLLL